MTIRVLLADDHEIVLEGLGALLATQVDVEVIGRARDGAEAVKLARELEPNLVIMDLSMPGLTGIEATRRIKADQPEVQVICLSMHRDRQFVINAIGAGASGYILKDRATEEVLAGIRSVMSGHAYMCPEVAELIVEDYRTRITDPSALSTSALSDREREVVQLIAEGNSTKEIASTLHVSIKTVSTHREHAMKKLDIHSLAGLTKYAIRNGLTTQDRDQSEESPPA